MKIRFVAIFDKHAQVSAIAKLGEGEGEGEGGCSESFDRSQIFLVRHRL